MRNKLISSLAGTAFCFAASGLAAAADMAVKAPPSPPPAPVYNWTGWYVGVNAGASFGSAKTDFNVGDIKVTDVFNITGDFSTGFAGSNTEYPDGFMGGGQIGYNWQYSPLIVVGFEADFQGAIEKDSNTLSNSFTAGDVILGMPGVDRAIGTMATNFTAKIDWFGTVRGRIGYVWGNGKVMSYLTGGLAYGRVEINGTNTINGTLDAVVPFSFTQAFDHSHVNAGWVAGYGTEGVLDFWGARNWTWKIEGLYMDLGHLDTASVPGASFGACSVPCEGPPFTGSGGQLTTHTHFTDGILRAGLNYKFY
jgi:outer membrane immunogenic protein